MACPELEDLLSGSFGDHVRGCERCRALLEAFAEVDSAFENAFKGISAPAGMASSVLARARISPGDLPKRPSAVPELLDMIGWAAVLVVAAIVLPRFTTILRSVWAGLG